MKSPWWPALLVVACAATPTPPPPVATATSVATSPPGAGGPDVAGCGCTGGPPTTVGRVDPDRLGEISGLAASRQNPGLLYAHNDSGDVARFFALDATGRVHAEIDLDLPNPVDLEDLGVGPCQRGSCVFLADIGDNKSRRHTVAIVRVPEPALARAEGDAAGGRRASVNDSPPVRITAPADRFEFSWPEGPFNAESLLVDPADGALYVVEKREVAPARVHRVVLPGAPDEAPTIERVGELSFPEGSALATGGAALPCGRGFAVRTYSHLWLYAVPGGDLRAALGAAPVALPVAPEVQGEAVAFALDGSVYFTASERTDAAPVSPLSAARCTPGQ